MGRLFKEAFPNASIKSELLDIFSDVMVDRIVVNQRMHLVKLYLKYDRLIQKKYIFSLENELNRKLFAQHQLTVKIYEKYELSQQYSMEVLLENYFESLLLEVNEYDKLMYSVLKKSNPVMQGDEIVLRLADSLVARKKASEIEHVFDKVLGERFGYTVQLRIEYEEAKESKYKKENEQRARRKLSEIAISYGGSDDTEGGTNDTVLVTDESESLSEDNEKAKETLTVLEDVDPETGEILSKRSEYGASALKGGNTQAKAPAPQKANGFTKKEGKTYGKWDGKKNFKREGGWGDEKTLKKSDNPDVVYNSDFDGDALELAEVCDEIGEIIVQGTILTIDSRDLPKSEKKMIRYDISDFTDSMKIKLFLKPELGEELLGILKVGDFIKVKGVVKNDTFDRELIMTSVRGIKKIGDFRKKREDNDTRKRVELHCHTKMSDMDAVSSVRDIVKQAKRYGHTAMAVTDHGDVQAFPDANHALEKGDNFKVIYGVEAYLVDDMKKVVTDGRGQSLNDQFVVFDLETTGVIATKHKIIEIGAVRVENGVITQRFSEFVNPKVPIPLEIEKLTGIDDSMVMEAPVIDEILPRFLEFCKDCVMVAHNADFDMGFIKHNANVLGLTCEATYIDTVGISRVLFPGQHKHTLDAVAKTMGVSLENHHRAVDDAEATAEIFVKFIPKLYEHQVYDLTQLNEFGTLSEEATRRLHYYHAIVLAKNEIGRRNLYKLVSMSNINYFQNRPKMPKSKIMEYREGLILGSACERGELYQAIADERSDAVIAGIVDFYDYLEIQPLGNNNFQIASPKYPTVESRDDLIRINKRIVELGEIYQKPVCATCDVHFLNPEDGIYRKIILAGKGFKDTEEQPDLFFRTTEEMLAEFEYLGSDKAEEVVVTNTNLIADMCEVITPVRPDKCPPVIEDSDKTLRTICYNKAHEMYGEELPQIVSDRLERELKSIIGNGFAVMYIIAQKLVWKSVEDGYLVGSRGSVGSSFVATMAGITEVNPLSPHYYCLKCHYSEFDSADVKAYAGKAGCDMPDKMCPHCGTKMEKDGFDIPFETFLGFKGDKEPDIDLNFSGEYQSKAHKYTEVIFGAGQTFRAGTIGSLADKTAYGYVKNYFRDLGVDRREGEINRIVAGCVGVRRTTGQHPGGIVVLPVGEDINSFTPVQRPANDMTTDTTTTHFDYHSIDHNLLKLDILGHDDPTMIRMLQDLTGIDPVAIPLDDKGVMSLFQDTSALKITPDQINGCKLGSLGIPEFGTDFAMGMLIETHPTSFSDLVRIAGLSHGTDVWLGNAQTLLQEGKATISTAICTRDDIMIYLISMGVESSLAFTIMEAVRKGKGLKPEWEAEMIANQVPEWYIWSCKKIKYMFPKAHAAAYVMMAWRIAYCKINYPLAYYCAYFSIRASAFSYELMCMGQARLEHYMKEYENKLKGDEKPSNKEQDAYKDMRIVQEMYARGYDFVMIDLYKAKARSFQIIDNKIMPAFKSIEGLGDKNADMIEDEAKLGTFISKDDFRQRTKTSQTIMETMTRLGILEGMAESNQLSIFDFV